MFVKGQSGNPKGRPKGKKTDCMFSAIKAELAKKCPNGQQTNEQLIASVLVEMASKGNLKAVDIVMAYTTPKPVERHEITGADGKAIESVVRVVDG